MYFLRNVKREKSVGRKANLMGAPRDGLYSGRVLLELQEGRSGGSVPNVQFVVVATRCQLLSVVRPSQSTNLIPLLLLSSPSHSLSRSSSPTYLLAMTNQFRNKRIANANISMIYVTYCHVPI
jgi:hypothetical protein